ncbi:hypothetical protein E3O45_15605 [Cryobacterium sp. TMS1-20-1]|uniref:hypothetical protein n=1 Tax=Cryobacterium sp. TMS1-20-1 TaxID=1259223 RepID=UPI001102090F|nr:hypothetical protein [Cryobacterium sp. TMS1-20-1]TFC70739.1 hypothetical protein E3O45_15605 [Cryobacterium sp. TMS1-20-1]
MVTVDYIVHIRTARGRHGAFYVWAAIAVLGFLVTSFVSAPASAAYGLARFLFAAPIYLAFAAYTRNRTDIEHHLQTFVLFFAAVSLSLPIQFLIGPIDWFVASSERAGFERFGSLAGSLTAIGVSVGLYLILASTLPGKWTVPVMIIIAVGPIVSLNKAAVANIAIAIVMIIWVYRRNLGKAALALSTAALGMVALVVIVPEFEQRIQATLISFGLDASTSGIINYDSAADESMISRLTVLPMANFEALSDLTSPFVYLLGGGFGMASTALVPEKAVLAPMAHNQFAELVTVFGFLGGGVLIVVMLSIMFRLWSKARADGTVLFYGVAATYAVFLFNSLFANGTVYQPSGASIFFLCMYLAYAKPETEESRVTRMVSRRSRSFSKGALTHGC